MGNALSKPAPEPVGFFHLPPELRNEIYVVLAHSWPISLVKFSPPAILAVHPVITQEPKAILYENVTFRFFLTGIQKVTPARLLSLPPSFGQYVRKLSIGYELRLPHGTYSKKLTNFAKFDLRIIENNVAIRIAIPPVPRSRIRREIFEWAETRIVELEQSLEIGLARPLTFQQPLSSIRFADARRLAEAELREWNWERKLNEVIDSCKRNARGASVRVKDKVGNTFVKQAAT